VTLKNGRNVDQSKSKIWKKIKFFIKMKYIIEKVKGLKIRKIPYLWKEC
jgi:hypothetical protein